MIRVLLVDDHQLVRQGVLALLLKAQDIRIVGEARDGLEAIAACDRLHPDVVLMDIEMPRMDGLSATRRLTMDNCVSKIIILTMRADETSVRQAARSGASGYLIKNTSREELIAAIRNVHNGGHVCSPGLEGFFRKNGDS